MDHNIKIGSFGQQLAADFLKQRNYQIVAQNYYTRLGEIDLIAIKDGQLIFVEVKTRLSEKFGLPEEAVTDRKKEKMYQTALQYLEKEKVNHDNFRFDILAVMIDRYGKKAVIRHHKNIMD
ncbi:MAG: YraN family protein [Candidatus Parcubacteria bacterium]|nr:YraN family protein [Candidatus Parcubacteria bacterium]